MPLTKVCPRCDVLVHVRKSACVCGHTFSLKQKLPRTSKRIAAKRALETENDKAQRRINDRLARAQKRALETVGETLERNEKDRACTANKRASESHDETLKRLEQSRAMTGP